MGFAHALTNCPPVVTTELYYISGDRALDDLVSAKTWRISEPVTSLVPHFYVLSWGYSLTAARVTAGDMKQPPWFRDLLNLKYEDMVFHFCVFTKYL